jgi:hypothetical protein
MATYKTYLEQLDVYPSPDQIREAYDFAQNKTTEYVHSVDSGAVITVEEGDVSVKWTDDKIDKGGECQLNAQSVFDESFAQKLNELQKE